MKNIVNAWNRVSLIAKIAIGIVIGAGLGILVPQATGIGLIGTMIESNCTNSGVCARNQFDCKCGERKWQAVPYDYIYVYFKYDACSGGRCECELFVPGNYDT